MLQGDVGPGEILFCEQNKKIVLQVAMVSHDDVVGYDP